MKYSPIVALVLFLGALQATAQVAILHPSGAVSVNNVAVNQPVPVFAGDRIATGSGATATIQSAGNRVSLPSGSSVVYGPHEVQVFDSGATISSMNGMTARFQGLTVSSPPNAAAQFEVRQDTAGTMVIATTGSVSVSDGTQAKSLAAGNSLVHSAWHPASMLSSNKQDPWSVQAWHDGDDHGGDKCDDTHDRGDHHDCECKHKDRHGHPESPIRPCRGDRHDEHCRCDDDGGHGHDR